MNHLVRCRGGEWRIEPWPGSEAWCATNPERKARLFHWNAYPLDIAVTSPIWPSTPAWLPVAWLCCEADPAEGPKFAAAILDAEPGDDAPALIAAEWLEELGTEGRFEVEFAERELAITFASDPLADWELIPLGQIHPRTGNAVVAGRGPLASWCRHLIATRCVACGGLRDGEDRIELVAPDRTRFTTARNLVSEVIDSKYRRELLEGLEIRVNLCPLCGYPAHPTPPPLAIPEVVK